MTPNLFLVGAPRCGTSSLFDWLCRHPEVVGTRRKEPFFLIDPTHPLARRPNLLNDGIEGYDDLFEPNASIAAVRIEGTTHYLFDPVARTAIARLPESRAIVVLREPADRVYSSFRYTANNLGRIFPGLTFARYLELITRGESLAPTWCRHPGSAHVLERDVDYSRYVQHVAPWLEVMGSERFRIVLMEEMIENPRAVVVDLFAWLGLDPSLVDRIEAEARNRTEQVRSTRLQAAARWLNTRLSPPDMVRDTLKRGYAAVQYRKSGEMSAEDGVALRELRAQYADDNAALSRLTGLDLTVWNRDEAGTVRQAR